MKLNTISSFFFFFFEVNGERKIYQETKSKYTTLEGRNVAGF